MLKDADKRLSRLNRNKIHLIPALAYPSEPDRLDALRDCCRFSSALCSVSCASCRYPALAMNSCFDCYGRVPLVLVLIGSGELLGLLKASQA